MVSRTLLLDCGNTACKYRFDDAGGYLDSSEGLADVIDQYQPDNILLASVSALGQTLSNDLDERGISHRRIRVVPDWQGLRLAYEEPERLGVDRWLTLVALAGRGRPAIVIDVGTALKIDALDANDQHLGGYILPGLRLMRQALVDDTFALPKVDQAGIPAPGVNTAECIANGAVLAAAGAVEKALTQYELRDPEIVWTGGDAERVRLHSSVPGSCRPALVFEGMMRLMKDTDYLEQLA